MMSNRSSIKWIGAAIVASAGTLLLLAPSSPRLVVSGIVSRIPAARTALSFRGTGFSRVASNAFESDRGGSLSGTGRTGGLAVTAPPHAGGVFDVRDSGGKRRASVHLAKAATAQPAEVESGIVTYRDVYPNVDVVAVRDVERFELGYVVHSTAPPELALDVTADGGKLLIERQTGAAVLQAGNGKPKLRIDPPVAFDTNGERRQGSYVLADADTLRISVDLRGMRPPIFIDPAFYIPYWTLVEDGRAPGGDAYNEKRQSRQNQIALNEATGRPWLIRPSATLDLMRQEEAVGTLWPEDYYESVAGTPRVANSTAPTPQHPLISQEFERTVYRESETYEWRDNAWQLLPHVGLPGLVDPSFAFANGKMFATGGQLHGVAEQDALTYASVVFQNDGNGWIAKGVPGGPPARVRAASAVLGSKLVVFGGRSLNSGSDLLNDTWTYDGVAWKRVPTSNPPPACESSQLLQDTRRQRLVLVGGNCTFGTLDFQPSDSDGFRLWEFDGVDWIRRFDIMDPALPRSFKLRRRVAAAWHPLRQTTVLFGGFVDVTEQCPRTDTDLASARHQADVDFFLRNDYTLKQQLESEGCWGGYVHDTWEWDGTALRQLTSVAFGGRNPPRYDTPMPVFQQLAGSIAAPRTASDVVAGSTTTKLWPWRYDVGTSHFLQRSALERSNAQPGVANAPVVSRLGGRALDAASTAGAVVSPFFAPHARPQLLVLPDNGKLLVFFADDGHVYETDLNTWVDRTPATSPFASGKNDFFAATFDTRNQRTVLFDPVDGATWEHAAAGWHRLDVTTPPGPWDKAVFTQDWWRTVSDLSDTSLGYRALWLKPPVMTFDRARGRTIMLHRNALWELDGSSWAQFATPAALKDCKASTLMAFGGARNKTVVVGCTVPAQTWEWDGASWAGPFASPYQDRVGQTIYGYLGTMQLEHQHPNALFESPTLGAVGIVDAAGSLRLWKGGPTWELGPTAKDPAETQAYDVYAANLSAPPSMWTAFFPPVIEDFGAKRLLEFRDGIRATQELKLGLQVTSSWEDALVGLTGPGAGTEPTVAVNPFPMELLPLEAVRPFRFADPATSTDPAGNPKVVTAQEQIANIFWPLRFLPDPVAKRVHILTHRGVFWELGSERLSDLGESCSTSADCQDERGGCYQGVCCNVPCDGRCLTCNGAHPGTCEALPAGAAEPQGRCGGGECAGVCSGVTQESNGFPLSACTFPPGRACGGSPSCSNGQLTGGGTCADNGPTCVAAAPIPVACGGGMKCADDTQCKPACTTPGDCQAPNQICSPDGTHCIPDGKVCHNNAECPKFNDCAADGKSCKPDAVLAAATAQGVAPSTWTPKIVRTPQEVAAWLVSQGYPLDEEGRVRLVTKAIGVVEPVFDPNKKTPITQFGRCIDRIDACRFATDKLDECVAATPRCVTDTPWLDDPGGFDCCPSACLTHYFDLRTTESGPEAMVDLAEGDCYPQLKEELEAP